MTDLGVNGCRMLEFPTIADPRGNLAFVESRRHVPFAIERVFHLYDVPGGAYRGSHAHHTLFQVLIAVSGSFEVHLDDGETRRSVLLNRANVGLLLTPYTWQSMDNFSSGSVCLVFASAPFDESDYLREYDEFLRVAAERRG